MMHKKMTAKNVADWTSTDVNEVKDSLGNAKLDTLNRIKNNSLYDAFASQPATTTVSAESQEGGGREGEV